MKAPFINLFSTIMYFNNAPTIILRKSYTLEVNTIDIIVIAIIAHRRSLKSRVC